MINRFALSFVCIELVRNEMLEVTLLYILLKYIQIFENVQSKYFQKGES